MESIVVVNNERDWDYAKNDVRVVTAKSYLTDAAYADLKSVRVYNLCRSYRYQSAGYYVSLLAQARGHRAIPNVTTIQDFRSQAIVRILSDDLDELIQKSLHGIKSKNFILSIYFGKNLAARYAELSKKLSNLFQAPLLRANFGHTGHKWVLQNISPIPLNEIPPHHKKYLVAFAREHFSRKRVRVSAVRNARYDLAILVNPGEVEPPSDQRALQKFVEAAEKLGIDAEYITADDYSTVAEFDALFIRETTAVNHYTYRFARRAFAEGLVVIDDPLSIVKCTNKVYLAELLAKAKIPVPPTLIVHRGNSSAVTAVLGLPCVLKQPDSSLSQGVIKVHDRKELDAAMDELLDKSDLVIAQAFMPTDFDWRIGVLDKTPLYACKYHMAQNHWQIYNWSGKTKKTKSGNVEAVPLNAVPKNIVDTAVRAANLIGDGFYGVDIKDIGGKPVVIEVNDNPSIDAGYEDAYLKDELYTAVMALFLKRLEALRSSN